VPGSAAAGSLGARSRFLRRMISWNTTVILCCFSTSSNISSYLTLVAISFISGASFCAITSHVRACSWVSQFILHRGHSGELWQFLKFSEKLFSHRLLRLNRMLLWALLNFPSVRYSWGLRDSLCIISLIFLWVDLVSSNSLNDADLIFVFTSKKIMERKSWEFFPTIY
jgi:hypothetical protein